MNAIKMIPVVALALAGCATWGYDESMAKDIRYCNMMALRADPFVGVPFVNLVSGPMYQDEIQREFARCARERGYVCERNDLSQCSRVEVGRS